MTARILPASRMVRHSNPARFRFETTAELGEFDDLVGQDRAIEAVAFGISIRHTGFNLFAMGPEGIGKYTLVRQFLSRRSASDPVPQDWCYVHNFADPRRPRAISLPAGRGRLWRDRMERLTRDLRAAIPAAFETDEYRNRREALEDELKQRREAAIAEFEERARTAGVAVVRTPIGIGLGLMHEGRAITRDEFEHLPEQVRHAIEARAAELEEGLSTLLTRTIPAWEKGQREQLRSLDESVTRVAVGHLIDEVRTEFADLPDVLAFLDEVEEDVVARAPELLVALADRERSEAIISRLALDGSVEFRRYHVNLIVDHAESRQAPVVYEDMPTQPNLIGRIENEARLGTLVTDFTLIRAGALHRANGGYLVLDARRLLLQPFAWEELKLALRAGEVRMVSPAERLGLGTTVSIEPQPIQLDLKVVLVGDRRLYYLLCEFDPDFLELFRIQADFEEDMPRTAATERQLVHLLGSVARREDIRPLDRSGAAAMVDHAARLAGHGNRLSTRLRSVTDVLREADECAALRDAPTIDAEAVRAAVRGQIRRSGRIQERVVDEIERGTLLIATDGMAIGQVNALTVVQLGEAAFGWPTRVTARAWLGSGELIDVEREVKLGGPIHSKGVLILEGFIGERYGRSRPLSLAARLVFEQSYGGVEGDSASLAECCALLSAIGGVPVRQSVALTGSINQHGEVQPIGGVNQKIEGFFDVCARRGLTGDTTVLIPAANVADLMLREDVVEAVAAGCFTVVAVRTVDEALEVLAGLPAGVRGSDGRYPDRSVNGLVERGFVELAEHAREFLAVPPSGADRRTGARPDRGKAAAQRRSGGRTDR